MTEIAFDPAFPEPGRLRQHLGLGQAEMAQLARASGYRTWQSWESGARAMPLAPWELCLAQTGLHPTLGPIASPATAQTPADA